MATDSIRPTKKQRDLLSYIEEFITEHGYSPSYREIMNGLDYTSVATVSLHVNSLIRRGHLRKRDRSARSLEVVRSSDSTEAVSMTAPSEEKWLTDKIDQYFKDAEKADDSSELALDELRILVRALEMLGLQEAANSFALRLEAITKKVS